MITADKRKAIYLLHQEGMSGREIARRLGVGRQAVHDIIKQEGAMPHPTRSDKQQIDPELLRRLYQQCDGYIQRVHEKLAEDENIQVPYSTLTRMMRQLGIGQPQKVRCDQVPDEPGAEMQHDTTVYEVMLGDKKMKVIASLLYLRYSKRRYLKFYRVFNRFCMKCFFHESLMFWKHAAPRCIIDNTNLARLHGSGSNAIIVPEMVSFGRQYGFEFCCHAIKHPNRKAGEERSFWTVETNFLPGRTFKDMEDLNQQALEWSTVRMENRPQGKVGIIPARLFEHEMSFLIELPAHLPAPYRVHDRCTDQYGYVSFDGNFYWVPGSGRDEVKVLQYGHCLKIHHNHQCLVEYGVPADGIKNSKFSPQGLPVPRHQPNNRKQPAQEEEKRLRDMDLLVGSYLDFALQTPGLQRHQFLRKLWALSRKMTSELFLQSIQRAHKYRIASVDTIESIALLLLGQGASNLPLVEVDEQFRKRDSYLEGSLTELPDLSIYDPIPEPNPPPNPNHE